MTAYTEALLNDEDDVWGRSLEDALYEAGGQDGAWPDHGEALVGLMNETIVCGIFCDCKHYTLTQDISDICFAQPVHIIHNIMEMTCGKATMFAWLNKLSATKRQVQRQFALHSTKHMLCRWKSIGIQDYACTLAAVAGQSAGTD